MIHVLLLGAGGMLASDLAADVPLDVRLTSRRLAELDITNAPAVTAALDSLEPDWIINASAYTEVDRAETDFERALEVNGTAVARLGDLAARRGVRIVHFSTDYVFAGDATRPYREDDPPSPVNAYGRSKLAGENGLRASGAESLIVRTQWLYGRHGKSFPATMWGRARAGLPTRVVADQHGSPTYSVEVARATWRLIAAEARGLYHICNQGVASWFNVAGRVFEAAGALQKLVPCTTADYPTPARRPRYSALDTTKVARDHGIVLPSWEASLTDFLAGLAR